MQLDYVEKTDAFVIRTARDDVALVQSLMKDHGFDFSLPASNDKEAVLFSHEPFAALTFFDEGTTAAKQKLARLKADIDLSWQAECNRNFAMPADKELWPFQRASLAYALDRSGALIADQPGLGKTPIAICYANEIQAKRVLCIVPANIRLQWEARVREWSTLRWPYNVHNILTSKRGVHPTAEWTIVSYDLARTPAIGKALAEGRYDLLILDEAHYLKTIDSRRTRAVFGGGDDRMFEPLVERCERVVALTGTPLPNRPRECYTLARHLCWESIDWASEDKFSERFNPSQKIERRDELTGRVTIHIDERTGRHAELQNRLRANFMVRHLKRDVMTQLKMPVYDLIQVEETSAVKMALKAESLLDIDPEDLSGADMEVLGHIAEARRLMGVAIAPQAADYIEMLLEGGEDKIVVFGWHIEVLDILEHQLHDYGVVRVDGSTGATRKEKRVYAFIHDPRIRVIVGNLQSMGVGTDGLQEVSNHALIVEPDWVPGNNIQAFDRLDRGGQTRTVQGDIFVAPNSLSERVLANALRKGQVIHRALDRRGNSANDK